MNGLTFSPLRGVAVKAGFLLLAIFLGACTQEKVLKTEVNGLDLSKIQTIEYFRANLEPSKEYLKWCNINNVPPIPKDEVSKRFAKNCELAYFGVFNRRDSSEKKKPSQGFSGV